MFEKLFSFQSAVQMHRAAPLAQEREDFLLHLHQRGVCRSSLRSFAASLNQIVRFLRLNKLRDVKESEIESAARRFKYRRSKRGGGPGPCTKPYFKWLAKRWLRFHGRLIPTPPPRQPFTHQLREYQEYMTSEVGLSKSTVQGRMCQAAKFLRWYSRRRKSLSRVSIRDVDEYFATQARNLTNVALASCAATLRAFFRYAESKSWCHSWISCNIKSPPIRRSHFTHVGPQWNEVLRLVRSIHGENPAEMRAKAILLLVSIYGLRRSEVIRLLVSDFDWKNMVFTVRRAKRGRVQQFPIGTDLSDALLQYIRYARPLCSIPTLFVTLGIPYKPMNPSSVSFIVNLRMKRWRICSAKKGPHSLRHACATRLLEKGATPQEIADFLGHRNSKSVGIYAKVDTKALRQVSELDPCGGL